MAKQRTKPIVIPDGIPDELKEAILGSKYPHVARVADPLLVRVDQLSLMVADVVYHARIKLGLGGKGFYIYASGLGTAIYENMFTHDKNDVKFNAEFGVSSGDTDEKIIEKIAYKAEDWLDVLEVAIASKQSDNPVKKAIDRMCWQLHYDITESHANFPVMFKSDDFSDVKIDRYPLDSTYFDGYTLKTTISDIAGVEHSSELLPNGQVVVNVTNEGYFSETSDRIQAFDDHMTKNAYDTNSDGAMKKLQTIIGDFDNHLTKGAWSSDSGAMNKIATKLVPDGNDYYSISECLRDRQTINGKTTFSIARSLRESGQNSVSQATNDQTELEEQRFTNIDNTLGTPSDSTTNTVFGSINVNASSLSSDISSAESTLSGEIDTIIDTIGTRANGTRTLMSRIGETTYGTNTIFGEMDAIYESMFGKDIGESGGHYGFVRGPGWVGQDWSNWVATEQ